LSQTLHRQSQYLFEKWFKLLVQQYDLGQFLENVIKYEANYRFCNFKKMNFANTMTTD
jgi:hypothetical protein